MAKKRKLQPSDPEPTKASEAEPQEEQSQEATVPVKEEKLQSWPDQIQEEDAPQEQQVDMAVEDFKQEEHEETRKEEQQEVRVKEEGEEQDERESLDASEEAQSVTANGTEIKEEEEKDDEDDDEEPVVKILETFSKVQLLTLIKKAVDNHPDLVDGVRGLAEADPAHRKIFVHGLGWDTTAENLISVFGRYGEIEDCKAVTDRVSGKSKGYAFILFKHRSGARKALRQPQKQIGNRTTSCQLASSGPVPAPQPVTPPVSEYTQRKIFVSNVSTEADTNKLLDFFKQYGEIEDGPLGLDKQTGKPKGFALFVYKTIDSAKKALEEPHKNFEGHTLHCQRAIDGPKLKHYQQQPPFPHHQHSHHHSRKEKNKYSSAGGSGPGHGHLMAPPGPVVGFNPTQGLNPVLGQALSTLLATQGAGLGLGNLLGGLGGAPVHQAGGPPAGYGNQAGGSYGNQPLMHGGYHNPQMGQSGTVRPQPGSGPPYMGH